MSIVDHELARKIARERTARWHDRAAISRQVSEARGAGEPGPAARPRRRRLLAWLRPGYAS